MNADLSLLQPYPFEKLRSLLQNTTAKADLSPIALAIGEPKHPAPQFVLDAMIAHLREVEHYPSTRGNQALRETIAQWLMRRFALLDTERLVEQHILPINGTREALFAIAQCVLDRTRGAGDVLIPNPFYQIYEGAVLMAGCKPNFYSIDDTADNNLDSIKDAHWQGCQMIYLCNPGNPTGSTLSEAGLQRLIERAQRYDFTIVSGRMLQRNLSRICRTASRSATGSSGNGSGFLQALPGFS